VLDRDEVDLAAFVTVDSEEIDVSPIIAQCPAPHAVGSKGENAFP
jgi:hypothetical protein